MAVRPDGWPTNRRLARRLEMATLGNLVDVKPVGEGVFKMHEHFWPGWLMYYAQRDVVLNVMLGGGDKSTQSTDIAKAVKLTVTLEKLAMTKTIRIAGLPEFDLTEYLEDEHAIAEYLTVVLDENDPAALAHVLGAVARARGMTEISKASGITREALYKALRPGTQPRFDTIARVMSALGVRLVAQPVQEPAV